MGTFRIIAIFIMAILMINIVRKLIMGEIKVAAWKNGTITDDDGKKMRLSSSRSFQFSFGFLIVAMAVFFFSE